jgi:hypothetical protein
MRVPGIRERHPPAGAPVLSRGRHPDAEDPRACLMEFTAQLAGERRSDRPACVHPLLSAVARVVNDSVTDAGRDELLARAPSFIGTTGDDARVCDRITLSVVDAALPVALPIWVPRLRRAQRRLRQHQCGPAEPVTRRRLRSAERTVELAAAGLAMTPNDASDAFLIDLLDGVLALGAGQAPRSRSASDYSEEPRLIGSPGT